VSLFGDYARVYDLLYRDKDYAGEARFVKRLLDEHAPGARAVLDLGCGSGRHAALLAEMGLSVHGLDLSAPMIAAARERAAGLPAEVAARLSFSPGDVRTERLGRRFDAAIALFHVMSYQTADADLRSAFATAAAHLRPGGVLLFDCWWGPCVLSQPPEVRVKRAEDDRFEVVRTCRPEVRPGEHVVVVNYSAAVRDKALGRTEVIEESHPLRYLFAPEVEALFTGAGARVAAAGEWLTGRQPGPDTFSVYFLGRFAGGGRA